MPKTIAFKEWSVVCEALGSGQQSVILRKGGIHEGRRGFQFEHREFALFPTRFHDQAAGIRADLKPDGWKAPVGEFQPGNEVCIRWWAQLEDCWTLTDGAMVEALQEFHIWTPEIVRERFEWALGEGDPPALNLALLRIFQLKEAWRFPYQRGHGGCRSWLELDGDAPALGAPVLTDAGFAELAADLRQRL